MVDATSLRDRALAVLETVTDPEIPVLTITDLGILRDVPAWRNSLLVELPNGDFAVTIARLLLFSAFADPLWRAATTSTDAMIAAIVRLHGAKLVTRNTSDFEKCGIEMVNPWDS